MVLRRRWCDPFHCAGNEVRRDSVDGDPAPGDQHAGLAGGAELRVEPALRHLCFERQRRIFLAHGTIRADRQDALSGPARALAGGKRPVGMPHVMQLRAVLVRRRADRPD